MNHPSSYDSLSLYPLDPRCALLTNLVWAPEPDGTPSLQRQALWVRFPQPLTTSGLVATFARPVGQVIIETTDDTAGARWRSLAEADIQVAPYTFGWSPVALTNIRIRVVEPLASQFPLGYNFDGLQLLTSSGELATIPWAASVTPSVDLEDHSPAVVEPFAGHFDVHLNERLGLCHERPETNRLRIDQSADQIAFDSPVFRMALDRQHARITHLGWDTCGQGRQASNLLCSTHTRGAFPIVMRDGRRFSSESCGGTFSVSGRKVRYQGIRPVPQLCWDYAFHLREQGFSLDITWDCTEAFHTSELAALRIPFDLYQSVVNVLAIPNTTGPSGLIELPLVINAPNHGVMRVTVRGGSARPPVLARVFPLRSRAELWLDLIPGAVPLPSGILEMPAGQGSVTLEFELTRIFPFANQDGSNLFGWWEMPPFYSFADRENILGALPNAWLNGLAFRPDLGRFANNSVADSAAACASYYAEIAAYTPMLADGLDPRQFIRIAAEQLLHDRNSGAEYSNWRHWPTAATAPVDCAWLYVAASGDWDWARRWCEPIRYYAEALLQLEHAESGLVASDFSGIPEDPGFMAACWCDSIRSGHLESYVNAHAFRGLQRAAELLQRLDQPKVATACDAMAARLKDSYLATFYDPRANQLVQWIAQDGQRFGFDSHMHLGAAVALGLVPDDLARKMLSGYLERLAASGFGHYEWGLPIFLRPIPAACHNAWMGQGVELDGSDQMGVYQNGAIHAHQTYYILQALYRSGMRHQANTLFARMIPLVRTGGLCGGLHSGVDWRHPLSGQPSGYEGLLAEQFHFLLAAITGYLGCELTIDGLTLHGPDTERIRNLRPNFARRAGQ